MHLRVLDESNEIPSSALKALKTQVAGQIRFGQHDRMLYSTDASIYQMTPLGVVIPRDTQDVQTTIEICRDHGLPVLPRGAGTSLAGQTVNRAVVIDCSAMMNRLIEVDETRRTARVQPGLVLDALRSGLAPFGLAFGPEVSTSTHATLGGMIGNSSAGLHSLLYGMTDEHVRAVDVVLPDGRSVTLEEGACRRDPVVAELTKAVIEVVRDVEHEIADRFPRTRRNVGGYRLDDLLAQLRASTAGTTDVVNLAKLICGSEGSLGFVTEATIDLVLPPARMGLAILGFPDVPTSLAPLVDILSTGPSAVELLDQTVIAAAARHVQYGRYVDWLPQVDGRRPGTVLFVDYFGDDDEAITDAFSRLRQAVPAASMGTWTDTHEQASLWALRKVGLGLITGTGGSRQPTAFVEDLAVPADRLCAFQAEFAALLAGHGIDVTYYAHASVGLLHMRPRLDLRSVADRDVMTTVAREATSLVQQYGGSVSAEHGDGRLRARMVHEFYGDRLVDAFRRIKQIFDPEDRFNPGMVTGTPAMLEHLRVERNGSFTKPEPIETFFHWDGDFIGEVERCNGNGLCRRTRGGAMCPSYRATLDERHSTRGRGNALRAAIDGAAGPPRWDDPDMQETLDLCLGCKACRYECPSNVDLARLKAEYDAQRFAASGRIPWRVKRLGRTRQMQVLGSRWVPVSNLVLGMPPIRWMVQRLLGLSTRRPLPRFERSLFNWFRGRAVVEDDRPTVVLLGDCFSCYSETTIGRAGVELLEAFGYRVVLIDAGCCGRTLISIGMLEEARDVIACTASKLEAVVEETRAVAVLGLEPSCITALQQEWTELRGLGPAAEVVSPLADTVERFLSVHWEDHPCRPDFAVTDEAVVAHQHCHQKHESEALATFLQRCGGTQAIVLDSGCCGMAGSFGYKKKTIDLSYRIARQSLGEAMAAIKAGPDSVLVAPGTSCRHQVSDVFGQDAMHPVIWAWQRMQQS